MAPSCACDTHKEIKHEYFTRSWKNWDHTDFYNTLEKTPSGSGIFDGEQLLRKIAKQCTHNCYTEKQRRKAQEMFTQMNKGRPELKKIGPNKPPHPTYSLEYKDINNATITFIGGSSTLNPASPKRKASESDGTSHSIDSDQPHTPPPKRQMRGNPIPPVSTPPESCHINTKCTSTIEPRHLDRAAAQKFMDAYLERHASMKTDLKFRLESGAYLEDRIAQHFQSLEDRDKFNQPLLASNIIDWEFDGEWLERVLKNDEVDFNVLRSQTQPPQIPPLPEDQEAWVDRLMAENDDERQEIVYYFNRPGPMKKEERSRNRWAANLINRWMELKDTLYLQSKDHTEHQYSTMIITYLIDGCLDRLKGTRFQRLEEKSFLKQVINEN
ncbi:MAG: hypothetical protein LQ349_000108 [Xanthoria aureola]|nr:MAG: hypothetical protein LQ349_000108 [Xanthoria aureola]